ncbi:MAG: hypothetical protein HQK53_16110 [Oligoflexia bacterium]|nr:hypothetical protein [Oligoflexia bacterium]
MKKLIVPMSFFFFLSSGIQVAHSSEEEASASKISEIRKQLQIVDQRLEKLKATESKPDIISREASFIRHLSQEEVKLLAKVKLAEIELKKARKQYVEVSEAKQQQQEGTVDYYVDLWTHEKELSDCMQLRQYQYGEEDRIGSIEQLTQEREALSQLLSALANLEVFRREHYM